MDRLATAVTESARHLIPPLTCWAGGTLAELHDRRRVAWGGQLRPQPDVGSLARGWTFPKYSCFDRFEPRAPVANALQYGFADAITRVTRCSSGYHGLSFADGAAVKKFNFLCHPETVTCYSSIYSTSRTVSVTPA